MRHFLLVAGVVLVGALAWRGGPGLAPVLSEETPRGGVEEDGRYRLVHAGATLYRIDTVMGTTWMITYPTSHATWEKILEPDEAPLPELPSTHDGGEAISFTSDQSVVDLGTSEENEDVLDATQTIPSLIKVLESKKSTQRELVLSGRLLAAIGAPALPALVDVLKEGTSAGKIYVAGIIKAIGTVPSEILPVLLELLDDENQDVREAALDSLEAILK